MKALPANSNAMNLLLDRRPDFGRPCLNHLLTSGHVLQSWLRQSSRWVQWAQDLSVGFDQDSKALPHTYVSVSHLHTRWDLQVSPSGETKRFTWPTLGCSVHRAVQLHWHSVQLRWHLQTDASTCTSTPNVPFIFSGFPKGQFNLDKKNLCLGPQNIF